MNANGHLILGLLKGFFEWVWGAVRLKKSFQGRNFEHGYIGSGSLNFGDAKMLIRGIKESLTIGRGEDMFISFIRETMGKEERLDQVSKKLDHHPWGRLHTLYPVLWKARIMTKYRTSFAAM